MLLHSTSIRIYGNRIVAYLIIALLAGLSFYLVLHTEQLNLFPYQIQYIEDGEHLRRTPFYCDFDADREAERLMLTSYSGVEVIELFDQNESFVEVLHVSGNLLEAKPSYMVSDLDHDAKAELYLVSVRNDSILLNGYEMTGSDGHFIKDHFIFNCATPVSGNDIRLVEMRPADLDSDGSEEIIMVLRAGLSLSPRIICSVHPRTLETHVSDNTAASYSNMMLYEDQNGKIERVVTGTSAFQNYDLPDTIPFNDNSGWIIHYSPDLSKVLFTREYPENKSYVFSIIKETASGPFFYALITEMKPGRCFLEKISPDGELLKRVPVGNGMNKYYFINTIFEDLDQLVALHSDTMYFFNDDLELMRTESGAGEPLTRFYGQSMNDTRQYGFLFFASGKNLYIRDSTMKVIAKTRTGEPLFKSRGYFSVKSSDPPDHYMIGITMADAIYHFRLTRNMLHPFRVPIYMMLYVLFFLGFYLLFRLQIYFFTRRQQNQRKIAELQLQTVRNQLQPHFTFNVLNTIGSLIYKDRKEKAYEYLNYFSDMLRSTLLSRNSSEWKIGEELDFIQTYIDMENLRFENRFKFELQVENEDIFIRMIPKMSVQAFVENAIRHGLMHREEDCRLFLRIRANVTHVVVEVEDNGIGRSAAAALQRHGSGIGNEILHDYMEVYNRIHKTKFKFTIQDLTSDDGSAAGTKVIYLIPMDFGSAN